MHSRNFILTCFGLAWLTLLAAETAQAADISRRSRLLAAETPPGCRQRLDAALLMGSAQGLRYEDGQWAFWGIVDDTAQEHLGPLTVDLVRVRYVYAHTVRVAWVAAGAQVSPASPLFPATHGSGYLSGGAWRSHRALRAQLQPNRTYVRVYAGAPGEPVAAPDGIDWANCATAWCRFAQGIESFSTLEDGLSSVFARSGMGAGWWPWGYLPWHIQVERADMDWCDYGL